MGHSRGWLDVVPKCCRSNDVATCPGQVEKRALLYSAVGVEVVLQNESKELTLLPVRADSSKIDKD